MKLERMRKIWRAMADRNFRHEFVNTAIDDWISTQIRQNREARGMSQAELGELAGMKQSAISRLESIDYSNWSLRSLRRLARAFDAALRVEFVPFSVALTSVSERAAKGPVVVDFDHDKEPSLLFWGKVATANQVDAEFAKIFEGGAYYPTETFDTANENFTETSVKAHIS